MPPIIQLDNITKTFLVDGQPFNALDGVTAKVDLEQKTAFVTITGDVSDDLLRSTIEDAGYTVVDIQ